MDYHCNFEMDLHGEAYKNILTELYSLDIFTIKNRQESLKLFQITLRCNNNWNKIQVLFHYYEIQQNKKLQLMRQIMLKHMEHPYIHEYDSLYYFVMWGKDILNSSNCIWSQEFITMIHEICDKESIHRPTIENNMDLLAINTLINEMYKCDDVYLFKLSNVSVPSHYSKYLRQKFFNCLGKWYSKVAAIVRINWNDALQWTENVVNEYTWKIKNFSQLRILLLEKNSPVFLHEIITTESGHCLSAFIYVDENQLKFYPVVVKGVHDNFISWPYKTQIQLSILTHFHSPIKKIIKKLDGAYFSKPVTSYNCICPKVNISLSLDELDRFLQCDTLSVQIKIL
jgi:hypothetical protein